MQFCSECHNMYYLKIQDDEGNIGNTLIYYCRNCGHEDTTLSTTNICVSDIQLRSSEKKYTNIVNEYTKYDPTLPRINTIKCPNQECSSNNVMKGGSGTAAAKTAAAKSAKKSAAKTQAASLANEKLEALLEEADEEPPAETKENGTQREVIYIRYDDTNMKYVYLCVHCDTTWRTDNRL